MKSQVAIDKNKQSRIFFGWWTVLATSFVTLWGHGFITQGFSAMFKPISTDLGITRAMTSVAASIGRFEGGIEAPITGWITDKIGPRWVILFGCFLVGLGLILMNYVNSLWAFYVVWGGVTASGLNIGSTLPVNKAISNWFVKKRGTALSVRAVFHGLATIAVLPLVAYLVTTIDWRMTCVIGGVVMWIIGMPLVWFLVKPERAEYYGLLPDGGTMEEELVIDTGDMISKGVEYAAEIKEVEFTFRQAIKTPAYWLLGLTFAVNGLVTAPIMIHGMPLLTDMGVDPVKAALMFSISGAAAIPTRLASGFLADRVKKEHFRYILTAASLLIAVGVFIFLLNETVVMAQILLITFYMGFTANFILNTAIIARYFGRKSLGSIQGLMTMIMTPSAVMAPIYTGWIYDNSGSYITALNVCAIMAVGSAILVLFALPPKPPALVSDIRKFL
ncbi:MAG TPA: MFS transporter [Dehalococcoidia bacterium]|nr:MFS transporter [Dehalococcoidia bacterium]